MQEITSPPTGVHESEEFWDRFTASSSIHPANSYRYTLISNLIDQIACAKDSITDLGCGNGALLAHFKKRNIGCNYIGIDGSAAIIECNRRTQPFAQFHQGDLQDPQRFSSFPLSDVVTCSEVVEHMPDYAPAFRIAHACLRPGGHFVLTTQGGKRRRHDIELLGHIRYYNIDELANEVADAGFDIIQKQQAGFPALTFQKIAASMFIGQVSKELASHSEPSKFFKFACKLIGVGLAVSSNRYGPQLVILAKKKS